MSLGAQTVASERRSEERRNFNDPETSPAGLEGLNATDSSLVFLLYFSLAQERRTPASS